MKSHVPFVWLIANLLHPLLLIIWFGEWDLNFRSDDIGIGLMILIYGFMFSLPSLLLGFLLEYGIFKLHTLALNRYLYWLLFFPFLALLNWVLVSVFFDGRILWNEFSIAIPSMISVLLASLLRYKSFLKEDIPESDPPHEQETSI